MLNITIVAIGKLKDKNFQAIFSEYVKRLQPFARLKVIELKASSFQANGHEKARLEEEIAISNYLDKSLKNEIKPNVFLLAERGAENDSKSLATFLDDNQPVVLIVGGALGFTARLYDKYPQISLSALTFPHELARVMLIEQIYRSATILNNKDYHY